MRILVAEDERNIATLYKVALESRGHRVVLHTDGVACLNAYREIHEQQVHTRPSNSKKSGGDVDRPFDVVILDYRMPSMDGLEVAKEILSMNSKQRIIFASAYVVEILAESVKQLGRVVELLPKPVSIDSLIDVVEDKGLYEELEKIKVKASALKNSNVTHAQLVDLLAGIKKLEKEIRGA